jgi:hypothetical protein
LYTLALKPAAPPKPAASPEPEPVSTDSMSEQQWFEALEAWAVDRASWDVGTLGPRPDAPNNNIPADVRRQFADRLRKRQQRRKEADEAAAKQAAADRELRDRLLAVTGGNYMSGASVHGLDDLNPVKLMLQILPIHHVLIGLKRTVDRRIDPRAPPIASWRDERFLRAVARDYALEVLVPSMAAAWKAAGPAPGRPWSALRSRPALPEPAAPEKPIHGAAVTA